MIKAFQPMLDEDDGTFWMSYEDFIQKFASLNVCRIANWDENRLRGKFIRIQEEN